MKRPNSLPLDRPMREHLTPLVHPATLYQMDYFHSLGLRERTLNFPVMVALVLTMIWGQIPSVIEMTRLLWTEGFLWCSPFQVSQQALSERLRGLLAELFARILHELLPQMHTRWQDSSRSLPRELALVHHCSIQVVDDEPLAH